MSVLISTGLSSMILVCTSVVFNCRLSRLIFIRKSMKLELLHSHWDILQFLFHYLSIFVHSPYEHDALAQRDSDKWVKKYVTKWERYSSVLLIFFCWKCSILCYFFSNTCLKVEISKFVEIVLLSIYWACSIVSEKIKSRLIRKRK